MVIAKAPRYGLSATAWRETEIHGKRVLGTSVGAPAASGVNPVAESAIIVAVAKLILLVYIFGVPVVLHR